MNAYAQCYQREPNIDVVIRHLKHQSVLEHVSYTFTAKMSRVAWAQLVRHRIASYTAQSSRATEPKGDDCYNYIPPDIIALGQNMINEWIEDCEEIHAKYNKWRSRGVSKQDARYIINEGVAIRVQFTMNLRSLINFWSLRMKTDAQDEIRKLAFDTWHLVSPTIPNIKPYVAELIG